MKTASRKSPSRFPRQCGSAVVVVLCLIAIASIYVAFNTRTLNSLNSTVRLLEHRQLLRLQATGLLTNAPTASGGSLTNLLPAAASGSSD
jgi:hypothetical protein